MIRTTLCRAVKAYGKTADRGMAALRLAAKHGSAICVSHGNLIAAVLNQLDPQFGFEGWRDLGNPQVIRLHMKDGVPVGFTL